jgi:hypothetical protein
MDQTSFVKINGMKMWPDENKYVWIKTANRACVRKPPTRRSMDDTRGCWWVLRSYNSEAAVKFIV